MAPKDGAADQFHHEKTCVILFLQFFLQYFQPFLCLTLVVWFRQTLVCLKSTNVAQNVSCISFPEGFDLPSDLLHCRRSAVSVDRKGTFFFYKISRIKICINVERVTVLLSCRFLSVCSTESWMWLCCQTALWLSSRQQTMGAWAPPPSCALSTPVLSVVRWPVSHWSSPT